MLGVGAVLWPLEDDSEGKPSEQCTVLEVARRTAQSHSTHGYKLFGLKGQRHGGSKTVCGRDVREGRCGWMGFSRVDTNSRTAQKSHGRAPTAGRQVLASLVAIEISSLFV